MTPPWGNHTPAGEGPTTATSGRANSQKSTPKKTASCQQRPSAASPPNGYGRHEVSSNIWEWYSDWFLPKYYRNSPNGNPQGPTMGRSRIMRGSSYLCHGSYCNRYRVAARSSNTPFLGDGIEELELRRTSAPRLRWQQSRTLLLRLSRGPLCTKPAPDADAPTLQLPQGSATEAGFQSSSVPARTAPLPRCNIQGLTSSGPGHVGRTAFYKRLAGHRAPAPAECSHALNAAC